ncbi:MAG: ATP-grasp domain-containing protein [Acidobacteria bacterium]|nr:ATP-grasp domain-containing protein [Acidobacteriota bacterium]
MIRSKRSSGANRVRPAVVLLDGQSRAALAIVRQLGSQGIPVWVGSQEPLAFAGYSRHAVGRFRYPRDESGPDEARHRLIERLRGYAPAVVMPTADEGWRLCHAIVRELPEGITIAPNPGAALFEALHDKDSLAGIARRCGVASPRTWAPAEAARLARAGQLRFPALWKPRRSFGGVGIERVEDLQRLEALLPGASDAVVQEWIEGEDVSATALAESGRTLAVATYRVLRQHPARYGPAVAAETIADEVLEHRIEHLLASIEYSGVANLDLRREKETGELYLVDFNARFGGTTEIALEAGVDVVSMLYDLVTGETPQSRPRMRAGVEFSWAFYGEIHHLAEQGSVRKALAWAARLRQSRTNGSWRDPLPHGVQLLSGALRRQWGRVP